MSFSWGGWIGGPGGTNPLKFDLSLPITFISEHVLLRTPQWSLQMLLKYP